MRATLRTTEAARLLNVSPSTLRGWERRYSWPTSARERGGHRAYDVAAVQRLADLLRAGHPPPVAIAQLRMSAKVLPCCPFCNRAIERVNIRFSA